MATILVIDDDPEIRKYLATVLDHAGHRVVSTGRALEAAGLVRDQGVELVITDIFMPEQDGIETLRLLCHQFPDLALIAISGGGSMRQMNLLELAGKLGAQACLQKPLDHETVLAAVSKVLDEEAAKRGGIELRLGTG